MILLDLVPGDPGTVRTMSDLIQGINPQGKQYSDLFLAPRHSHQPDVYFRLQILLSGFSNVVPWQDLVSWSGN